MQHQTGDCTVPTSKPTRDHKELPSVMRNWQSDDLVWGVPGIAAEINTTKNQAYHLIKSGALAGAVAKLGHKTIVGSRHRLHAKIRKKMGAAIVMTVGAIGALIWFYFAPPAA
jgi:hypothetical protein